MKKKTLQYKHYLLYMKFNTKFPRKQPIKTYIVNSNTFRSGVYFLKINKIRCPSTLDLT